MNERFILGLDISTTCTGVSIVYVDENNVIKPLVVTHLKQQVPKKNISNIETLFLKCNLLMEKIEEILKDNHLYFIENNEIKTLITDIVIEEPLLSSNNQNTVATLLRYNGMVAYKVYNLLNIVPQFISSYDARMYGVPSLMAVRKYNKAGNIYPENKIKKAINSDELVLFGAYPFDCAKKLILWNYVSERFPEIQWVYNKKGELSKENFDASDSLICVLGLLGYEKYKDTKPHVVDFTSSINNQKTTLIYSYEFCDNIFTKTIEL